jgi:DNA-binding protein HU-beta
MTQTQLADAVADKAGLSRADAKKALAALEEVVLDEIGNAEKIKIGGVVQLDVRVRPATVARPGRNPATGEEIMISAKPASVAVRFHSFMMVVRAKTYRSTSKASRAHPIWAASSAYHCSLLMVFHQGIAGLAAVPPSVRISADPLMVCSFED